MGEERQHPHGLRAIVAQVILNLCKDHGLLLPPDSLELASASPALVLQQAASDRWFPSVRAF